MCRVNIISPAPNGAKNELYNGLKGKLIEKTLKMTHNHRHNYGLMCLSTWTGPRIFQISDHFVIFYK